MRVVLVCVALLVLSTGCASSFGEGHVYGASYPASAAGGAPAQASARALSVYGLEYPRGAASAEASDVAAPSDARSGKSVYGFEYPRGE